MAVCLLYRALAWCGGASKGSGYLKKMEKGMKENCEVVLRRVEWRREKDKSRQSLRRYMGCVGAALLVEDM